MYYVIKVVFMSYMTSSVHLYIQFCSSAVLYDTYSELLTNQKTVGQVMLLRNDKLHLVLAQHSFYLSKFHLCRFYLMFALVGEFGVS